MMVESETEKKRATHLEFENEPRWPALMAIFTTGMVYAALPEYLSVGPRWLLIALVSVLELPTMIALWRGKNRMNRILGFLISGLMTLFLLWSLVLLVWWLPSHKEEPLQILESAAILWVANIIVFALWYWRLDGGGPLRRDRKMSHTDGAFLFPQMTWEKTSATWTPKFVDYLFLSFNTSTAFSPTDAPVLSRWAKVLLMLQSSISLTIVALLAARAVNIM